MLQQLLLTVNDIFSDLKHAGCAPSPPGLASDRCGMTPMSLMII